jgi:hypothetical protein
MPDEVATPVEEAVEPTTPPDDKPEPPKNLKEATKGVAGKPKTPGPAPWTKDLEGMGLDPETLTKFDDYLRTNIQPHTTKLEQRTSGYDKMFGGFETHDGSTLDPDSAAEMASELLQSLASDPQTAVKEIIELMNLDPQSFLAVQQEMQEQMEEDGDQPSTEPDAPQEPDERQQWIDQQIEREKHAKEDEAWEAHLKELADKHEGHFGPKTYTMAMAGVGPDPDTALQWYQQAYDEIAGIIEAKNAPPKPAPSATLGEGHPTPPEDYNDSSIKSAVKGFAADMRAARGRQ